MNIELFLQSLNEIEKAQLRETFFKEMNLNQDMLTLIPTFIEKNNLLCILFRPY